MHSILVHKFTQNPHLQAHLIATGEALLVEANQNDRIWRCGMSYDQVMQAVHHYEGRNQQWTHTPNTNLLGKLLMRVRSQLQMHQSAVTWPRADLDRVMNLANILRNQTIQDIIILAGTNSLTSAKPWEALPPDSHDGAAQRASLGTVIEGFQDRLEWLQRNHPYIYLHITEIPFRWCDPAIGNIAHAPAKMSRVQKAVTQINGVFRETANQSHGQVRLFQIYYPLFDPENFITITNEFGEQVKGLHFSQLGIENFSRLTNTYLNNL